MGLNVFKRRCAHRILGHLEECPECVATMRARALESAGPRWAKPLHTQPFQQPTREDVAGAIGQVLEGLMKSGVLPGNASVSGDTVTLSAGPRKDNPDMSDAIGSAFDALNSGGFRVASTLGHLEVNGSAPDTSRDRHAIDGLVSEATVRAEGWAFREDRFRHLLPDGVVAHVSRSQSEDFVWLTLADDSRGIASSPWPFKTSVFVRTTVPEESLPVLLREIERVARSVGGG